MLGKAAISAQVQALRLDAIWYGCHKVNQLQTGWMIDGPSPVCKFEIKIRVSFDSYFFKFFLN